MTTGRWFVGAGAAATSTTLAFDERELDVVQYAVTASAGYATPARWSFRLSLGAVLGGNLEGGGVTHDIGPGFVVAAGVAKQLERGPWFLNASVGTAVSRTTTDAEMPGAGRRTLVGLDIVRIGVMAGRTIGVVSPYVLARGFGGPVWWTLDGTSVTGTDTSKFQLGAGANLALPQDLAIQLDVSALGERSVSLGMSYRL